MASASLLLLVAVVVLVTLQKLYASRSRRQILAKIPTHAFDGDNSRARYIKEQRQLLLGGYKKYSKNDQTFKTLASHGGYKVILCRKHLEETKHITGKTMSFNKALENNVLAMHTGAPPRGDWSARALRIEVTKRLDDLVGAMTSQADTCFDEAIPQGDDWTRINLFKLFHKGILGITVGVLCGDELAKDKEWTDAVARFSGNLFGAGAALRKYSYIMRVIMGRLEPICRQLRADRRLAKRKLEPYMRARQAALKQRDGKRYEDGLQWMVDACGPDTTPQEFSDTLMRIMNAAIHSSAITSTSVLAELLYRPEYIPELAKEAREVFEGEGVANRRNVDKLRKLDSFIKETIRFTAPQSLCKLTAHIEDDSLHVSLLTPIPASVNRYMKTDYTFSDGTTVPAGIVLSAPTDAIYRDPDIFPEADVFKPWRFSDMDHDDSKHQIAFTSEEWLQFGYGVQACPGRWFAAQEMKIMIAKLILEFDMKMDVEASGKAPSPKYVEAMQITPAHYWMYIKRKSQA